MKLQSTGFEDGGMIPAIYTCDGENISPHLQIEDVPAGTESLALIVDDPDAPGGTWTHWTLWNIPSDTTDIEQDFPPESAEEGITSSGAAGYHGPCPPTGAHRYVFHLYALDTTLASGSESTADELRAEMSGHILAEAELTGIYERR